MQVGLPTIGPEVGPQRDQCGRAYQEVQLRNGQCVIVRELSIDDLDELVKRELAAEGAEKARVFIGFVEFKDTGNKLSREYLGSMGVVDFQTLAETFEELQGDLLRSGDGAVAEIAASDEDTRGKSDATGES